MAAAIIKTTPETAMSIVVGKGYEIVKVTVSEVPVLQNESLATIVTLWMQLVNPDNVALPVMGTFYFP